MARQLFYVEYDNHGNLTLLGTGPAIPEKALNITEEEYKNLQEALQVAKIDTYVPTIESINLKVRKKISEKYDFAQELQMLNKGMENPNDTEYLAYKAYRKECVDWGIAEKAKITPTA